MASLFLLAYCLCLSITIILQANLMLKFIQFLFFFLCVLYTGTKMQLVGCGMVFIATVLSSLVFREGKVLFTVFGFPITHEALFRGLERGLSIITLFYMSKLFLSLSLIPQETGSTFLTKVFRFFQSLTSEIKQIRINTFLQDIDRLLLQAEGDVINMAGEKGVKVKRTLKFLLYAIALAGNFFLLILSSGGLKK